MFDGNWRTAVDRALIPMGVSLRRTGITADMVTITGIAMAGAAAYFIGQGWFRLGVLFLALTGVPDALDGAVAKASGTSSDRGAFFDSVSDRLTDAILFGGVAWYLASNEPGRIMMLPVGIMAAAMMVSYQRAKAESLGFDAKGGIMERAERFIVLGIGLLFNEILIPILWIMFALTAFTALQRFAKVWKQASATRPAAATETQLARRSRLRIERQQRKTDSSRRPGR